MRDKKSKTVLIYTPEYAKDLPDLKLFAIYPDYWGEHINLYRSYKDVSGKTFKYKTKHNWGEVPCLGYVKEQDEHWAIYAALTAQLVQPNVTFNLRAIEIKTGNPQPIRRKPYVKPRRVPNKPVQ